MGGKISMVWVLCACIFTEALFFSPVQSKAEANVDKVYKIKYSTVLNEASTWYQMGLMLAEKMDKETNGRIKITCYANEQLSGGNQQKGCEMLMNGSTELDMRSAMIWAVMNERLGVWTLPFFYESYDVVDSLTSGAGGKAYAEVLDNIGVKLLGYGETGMRQIITNKPLRTFEDIKGMKIRVPSVTLNIESLKAFGANPLAMNWSEAYTGLQQGTVDGMETPTQMIIDNSLYEVCKYIYMCNWTYDPGVLTINRDFYNSLPEDLREIFDRVARECILWQKDYQRKQNIEAVSILEKEYNCELYTPTREERQKFIDASQGVIANFEKKVGKRYLDLFRVK